MVPFNFKQNSLGKIHEKTKRRRDAFNKIVVSVILLFLIALFLPFIFRGYNYFILLGIALSIWFFFYVKYYNIGYENILTGKERTLFNLYYALDNLNEYIGNRNPKKFKKCLKYILCSKNSLNRAYFDVFGTKWEEDTNLFFGEVVLYFEVGILSKVKMDTSDSLLWQLQSTLLAIFGAIEKDNYSEAKAQLKKINEKHKVKKRNILDIYKVDKSMIVNVFFASVLITITFFAYWGYTKFVNTIFSLETGVILAFGMSAALYYGMVLFREVRKR